MLVEVGWASGTVACRTRLVKEKKKKLKNEGIYRFGEAAASFGNIRFIFEKEKRVWQRHGTKRGHVFLNSYFLHDCPVRDQMKEIQIEEQ